MHVMQPQLDIIREVLAEARTPKEAMSNMLGIPLAPPTLHVLSMFNFGHLPPHIKVHSQPFAELAAVVATTSSNIETTVALRKLLEAKDAAVRAAALQD